MVRLLNGILASLLSVGCMEYVAGAAAGAARLNVTPSSDLLIFGGRNHDVFLGCLTCSEFAASSVFNDFGQHGSPYGASSIRNEFSQYGSPYSHLSACNPYASNPPVIVDRNGRYYGELTMNQYSATRTRLTAALQWLAAVCAQ